MRHERQAHVVSEKRHALAALDAALRFDRLDVHEDTSNAIGTRHGILHADVAPR